MEAQSAGANLQRARHDLTLAGFLAAGVFAVLSVGGTYWYSLQQTRAQQLISHKHEVLAVIATARADLLEIQSSLREFAITGREDDLQPYVEARNALRGDVRRLQELAVDNPVQQSAVLDFEAALEPRFATAAAVIAARRTGGLDAARPMIESGALARQNGRLAAVLQRIDTEESRLLALRLSEHERRLQGFWGAIATLLAGLMVTLTILYRQQRRRERAEVELLRSEQRFHLMTDSVTDYAIFMLDPQGRVRSWNPGAQRIKGYTADEIIGRDFACFYPAEDRAAGKARNALATAAAEGRFSEEGWRLRKDGQRFWASVTIAPLKDAQGGITGYAKVTRDLTERLESEQAERTRELSVRLIAAQEEERRHVARELHDETGQALTLIRMNLAEIQRHPGAAGTIVADCIQLVDRAVAHIRGLSQRLRPPMLDDLGLPDALRWMLEQQARAAGWRVTAEVPELNGRLPQEIETACFRIAQEALTNAARYSGARQVSVELQLESGQLYLKVRDDGRGFDLARFQSAEERARHYGLVSMTERAALLGGQLTIETAAGEGTRIVARLPIPGRTDPTDFDAK